MWAWPDSRAAVVTWWRRGSAPTRQQSWHARCWAGAPWHGIRHNTSLAPERPVPVEVVPGQAVLPPPPTHTQAVGKDACTHARTHSLTTVCTCKCLFCASAVIKAVAHVLQTVFFARPLALACVCRASSDVDCVADEEGEHAIGDAAVAALAGSVLGSYAHGLVAKAQWQEGRYG